MRRNTPATAQRRNVKKSPLRSSLRRCAVAGVILILFLTTFRNSIDWRGPRDASHRILFKQSQTFLHRSLELRIMPFIHVRRRVVNLDIRRDADILHVPLAFQIIESEIWGGDATTIDCCWKTEGADQPAPSARSDKWSNLAHSKHVRQRVAARSRRLVDD